MEVIITSGMRSVRFLWSIWLNQFMGYMCLSNWNKILVKKYYTMLLSLNKYFGVSLVSFLKWEKLEALTHAW